MAETRRPFLRHSPCASSALHRVPAGLALVLACFFGTDLNAAGQRQSIRTQNGSGISIAVQPFFSEIPPTGYFPARVSIENHSGSARRWDMASQITFGPFSAGSETEARFRFEVPDGETGAFDILVPVGARVANSSRTAQPRNVRLNLSGFGVPSDGGRVFLSSGYSVASGGGRPSGLLPFAGMTEDLHAQNWGPLFEQHNLLHMRLQAARINPNRLPGDWRGLSGFDAIWMTDEELRRIGGIERRALLDWTAAGGRLLVCREDENGTIPLPIADSQAETPAPGGIPYGFGRVHFIPRDGLELDVEAVTEAVNRHIPSGAARFERQIHTGDWDLFYEVGLPGIPVLLFSGFLAAFVVLIGPINFLFIAKPGRRYRLLWTTPLISVGAGSLLFLLILFYDGTGGTGQRLAVWHHLPEENKAVVLQDQVSRTGLLLGSRFTTEEPSVITQLNLDNGRHTTGERFTVAGGRYEGDWFLSRSAQAQWLRSVPSTRWRVELHNASTVGGSGGPAPEIVSTLPHALDKVFYRDADGRLWTGGPLAQGTPVTLEPSDENAFDDWWRAENLRTSPVTRGILEPHRRQTGYFFASASGNPVALQDTLPSIDWREPRSLHLGPISSAR